MREWLVIEKTISRSPFARDEERKPSGYIPRDAAEALLGRDLGKVTFFRRDESEKMRQHPEWCEALDE
jgi:hypothetical protein